MAALADHSKALEVQEVQTPTAPAGKSAGDFTSVDGSPHIRSQRVEAAAAQPTASNPSTNEDDMVELPRVESTPCKDRTIEPESGTENAGQATPGDSANVADAPALQPLSANDPSCPNAAICSGGTTTTTLPGPVDVEQDDDELHGASAAAAPAAATAGDEGGETNHGRRDHPSATPAAPEGTGVVTSRVSDLEEQLKAMQAERASIALRASKAESALSALQAVRMAAADGSSLEDLEGMVLASSERAVLAAAKAKEVRAIG